MKRLVRGIAGNDHIRQRRRFDLIEINPAAVIFRRVVFNPAADLDVNLVGAAGIQRERAAIVFGTVVDRRDVLELKIPVIRDGVDQYGAAAVGCELRCRGRLVPVKERVLEQAVCRRFIQINRTAVGRGILFEFGILHYQTALGYVDRTIA